MVLSYVSIIISAVAAVYGASELRAGGTLEFASLLMGVLCLPMGSWLAWDRHRMNTLRRHAIRTTASRLEKIVRMGSPLEDHGVHDLGARVHLQLRLADAEAALDLVKTVLAPSFSVKVAQRIATSPEQLRERHP
jgi:hypothetical protein